jgi:SAM-dependent methyltransferase
MDAEARPVIADESRRPAAHSDNTIEQAVEQLFAAIPYWPSGMYFRSAAHRRFLLEFHRYTAGAVRCLDLGCGPDFRYRPFIEAHGLEWSGADILELNDAERAYRQIVDNHIDFADGTFDIICTYNVIEHFDHPEQMFAEINRCLAPGGILCGACAFLEMEHDSFFHLTHNGLKAILARHGFELLSLAPSEYSGLVLVAQRFFGGKGRVVTRSGPRRWLEVGLRGLNWIPFLIINALELPRKTIFRKWNPPLRDCATLYFYARRR